MADDRIKVVKATSKGGVESKQLNVIRRPSPDFVTTFCNSANVGMNFFDLTITFGRVADVSEDSITVQENVAVAMSLEHAAALLSVLQEHIGKYEQSFGPLRKKPSDKAPRRVHLARRMRDVHPDHAVCVRSHRLADRRSFSLEQAEVTRERGRCLR